VACGYVESAHFTGLTGTDNQRVISQSVQRPAECWSFRLKGRRVARPRIESRTSEGLTPDNI